MSFSCTKSLLGITSHVFRRVVNSNIAFPLSAGCRWGISQSERTLTRSMWHMSRRQEAGVAQVAGWTKRCQCCGLHTAGDKAIADFLTEEIELEQKIEKKLPKIKGFELSLSGTSDVEFTKTDNNEIIKVKFNINNSVNDLEQPEENPQDAVQMVSRPPFIVELTKDDRTFAMSLSFPDNMPDEIDGQAQEEDYEDEVILESVALLNKGEEWNEKVYALQGHNMDGTLYDLLLDTLDERGITDKFLDELIQFATSYEQQKYVSFLQNLKKFCSSD